MALSPDDDVISQTDRHGGAGSNRKLMSSLLDILNLEHLCHQRFLILVLRNLKTKLLGFGIESGLFPWALWGCSEQSCDSAVLHEDGTRDYSMLSLFCD